MFLNGSAQPDYEHGEPVMTRDLAQQVQEEHEDARLNAGRIDGMNRYLFLHTRESRFPAHDP